MFAVTQDSVLLRNAALGQAAGGAAGSGLGGGLYLEPTCLGGAGCKSAFALLNNTLLEHNTASQVQTASLLLPARVSACCLCTLFRTLRQLGWRFIQHVFWPERPKEHSSGVLKRSPKVQYDLPV